MQTITTDSKGKVMIHENGRVREMSEREMLRAKFILRASNPPTRCSEFSREWSEYVQEMRNLEDQLRGSRRDAMKEEKQCMGTKRLGDDVYRCGKEAYHGGHCGEWQFQEPAEVKTCA